MVSLSEESCKTLEDEHLSSAGTSAREFLQFWTETYEDNTQDRVEESTSHVEAKESPASVDNEKHV